MERVLLGMSLFSKLLGVLLRDHIAICHQKLFLVISWQLDQIAGRLVEYRELGPLDLQVCDSVVCLAFHFLMLDTTWDCVLCSEPAYLSLGQCCYRNGKPMALGRPVVADVEDLDIGFPSATHTRVLLILRGWALVSILCIAFLKSPPPPPWTCLHHLLCWVAAEKPFFTHCSCS